MSRRKILTPVPAQQAMILKGGRYVEHVYSHKRGVQITAFSFRTDDYDDYDRSIIDSYSPGLAVRYLTIPPQNRGFFFYLKTGQERPFYLTRHRPPGAKKNNITTPLSRWMARRKKQSITVQSFRSDPFDRSSRIFSNEKRRRFQSIICKQWIGY